MFIIENKNNKKLNFKSFQKKYCYSQNSIKKHLKILENSISKINKLDLNNLTDIKKLKLIQKKIEKSANTFFLTKSANKFNLNPIWKNFILSKYRLEIFSIEELLDNLPNFYIKKLKKIGLIETTYYNLKAINPLAENTFSFVLSSADLLAISLYSLFKLNNSVDDWEDNNLLKITYITSLSLFLQDICISYCKTSYVWEFLSIFFKKIPEDGDYLLIFPLKEDLLNFKLQFLKYWRNKNSHKPFFCEDILIYFINTFICYIIDFTLIDFEKTINKKSKIYKKILNDFNDYFKSEKLQTYIITTITDFIRYFVEHCIIQKIFRNVTIKKPAKRYDYVSLFSLSLYTKLSSLYIYLSQLPMICEPLNWNNKGLRGGYLLNNHKKIIQPLVKPLLKGNSTFYFSSKIINSVNLLQKKQYKIDKTYFKVVKTDHFKSINCILSDWSLYLIYLEFFNCYQELKTFDINFTDYYVNRSLLFESELYINADSLEKSNLLEKLKQLFGLTARYYLLKSKIDEKEKTFLKYWSIKLNYNYIMTITEIFSNLDFSKNSLYVVSTMDFRGRVYPSGRLHRASGMYKRLLTPKNSFYYTEEALNELKKSAITNFGYSGKFHKDYLLYFDKIISQNNYFYIFNFLSWLLENWCDNVDLNFKFNSYDYFKIAFIFKAKDFDFFVSDLYEFLKSQIIKSYKSCYQLFIDQKNSGPMIYGFLNKDSTILNLTGVTTIANTDIYSDFICKLRKDLFNSKSALVKDKNDIYLNLKEFDFFKENFDLLFTRADFAKLLIMPLFYNMQVPGIKKLIKSCMAKKKLVLNTNFTIIGKFSSYLYKLSRKLYYKTLHYQDSLVQIARILYSNSYPIILNTLDGGIIKYTYTISEEKVRKYFLNGKYVSYRIYLPTKFSKNISKQHYLTLPPNFIHSIDASICRLVILEFYNILGVILEPLHDSFGLAPIYISSFLNLIKFLYVYSFNNKWLLKNNIILIKTFIKVNGSSIPQIKVIQDFKLIYLKETYELIIINNKPFLDNPLLSFFNANMFDDDSFSKIKEIIKKINIDNPNNETFYDLNIIFKDNFMYFY